MSTDLNVSDFGLVASGISKSFRGRRVLDEVDLAIPRGSLALLEGANGAGKTTLLRIFCTLVLPDGGGAWVCGSSVTRDAKNVRRVVGVALVNERSLYWRLSGRDNLYFFASSGGLSKRETLDRIGLLVEELGLSEVISRRVASLSSGQRQRLLLARAALRAPSVLLLDEPLRGLDDDGMKHVLRFARRRAEAGTTVLVTAPRSEGLSEVADLRFHIAAGRVDGLPPEKTAGRV